MNNSLSLQQSLKQQLTLSPQLIQTFEVLAMSTVELQERIRSEIEQNPALEIPSEKNISIEQMNQKVNSGSIVDDYSDKSSYGSDRYSNIRESSFYDQEKSDNNQMFIESALAKGESLQDHLLEQLGCTRLTDEEKELGNLIISNLDHNGFHRNEVTSLAPPQKIKKLLKVLSIIQKFDPIGVAAKDIRESLVLQASGEGLEGEDLEIFSAMVYEHLELLKGHKFKETAKKIGTQEHKVELLYNYLKTLNPYPASGFDDRETQYIIPDLTVKNKNGHLTLQLNTGNIPELIIDEQFTHLTDKEHKSPETKEANHYIKEAIKSASLLISSVSMRNETVRKIGLILLEEQYEFFLHGPKALKPLTYRNISTRLNLHETTISRAVMGKYIDTDWGIIPIKELFSSALSSRTSESGEVSKRAVKEMVENLIRNHKGPKPLSDQKISDILQEQGIKIARRTVSKYRKELKIESSYER
ncbi:MAG: RNA polymerase factor sigma-54 [Sphaerochaetaceae bacterium]